MNQLIFNSMKRIYTFLFVTMAMLMLSVSSAWAGSAFVKLTAEDGTVSWIEIIGTINGTDFEIYKDNWDSAISKNNKGSIDLNEVWAQRGREGTHYQVTSIGRSAFYFCRGLTSVEIPSSVTSIGNSAFYGCSGLTSIVIPSSVTSIGDWAFNSCSSLISVEIPSSVTNIGESAFYYCSSLTTVVIPSSVTSVGDLAFRSCRSLTSIEIPSSVTSIGYSAFSGCSGLTSVVIESGNSVYDSRNHCNAIIETASNTLIAGCKNTKIPSSVTSIGEGAFSGCSGLTSIDIPINVTRIGNSAFSGCWGLTSIDIPSSVTSIGEGAFSACSGLTSITSYITDVFETGGDAFYGCDKATLYVPSGLVSTYQSKADWNYFSKIEEIPSTSLTMSCNNKGNVKINGMTDFTNNVGEVSVYDGVDNTFTFQPNDKCELRQVLIDGLDVTLSVENNQLTTKVHEGSKMIVMFDKSGSDVNGDGIVNISDVVALVNLILGQ